MDVTDQQDGYLLGVMAKMHFAMTTQDRGIRVDELEKAARIPDKLFRQSFDRLIQRGFVAWKKPDVHCRLTATAMAVLAQYKPPHRPS